MKGSILEIALVAIPFAVKRFYIKERYGTNESNSLQ